MLFKKPMWHFNGLGRVSAMNPSHLILADHYDYTLVASSVLIAVAASYAAFDLAERVTAVTGRVRLYWLFGGAAATGIGTWSMHYVGMLAFRLPIPVQYDWPTALASLGAAIFSYVVALVVVSRPKMGWAQALVRRSLYGRRYGRAALHCYGFDAAVWRMSLFCAARRPFSISGGSGLAVGVVVDIFLGTSPPGPHGGKRRVPCLWGRRSPACTIPQWPRLPLRALALLQTFLMRLA